MGSSSLSQSKSTSLVPLLDLRLSQHFTFSLTPVQTTGIKRLAHHRIIGLSAMSFASAVIWSADAKETLLRHEVYNERALSDTEENTAFKKVFVI